MCETRINELETKLADLKNRIPPHSIPSHMMIELEELEAELETIKKE
ncbi:histidine kinase [Chloroflexota bacterium]